MFYFLMLQDQVLDALLLKTYSQVCPVYWPKRPKLRPLIPPPETTVIHKKIKTRIVP